MSGHKASSSEPFTYCLFDAIIVNTQIIYNKWNDDEITIINQVDIFELFKYWTSRYSNPHCNL